eukprot:TRINITY_DN39819_c0_g2_i1.p1 TRINITY_DN39819_c0_g2~~TRINITY_DN39819_c0_g2_i1.p1  ORF type:complete len:406 (-),score=50.06 TRINITY_DN39819_c0_g2_i1:202-1419(-)
MLSVSPVTMTQSSHHCRSSRAALARVGASAAFGIIVCFVLWPGFKSLAAFCNSPGRQLSGRSAYQAPPLTHEDGSHAERKLHRRGRRTLRRVSAKIDFPEAITEIEEDLALAAAKRYDIVDLQLSAEVASGPIGAAFIGPHESLENNAVSQGQAPVVLLHGFDSSSLEFRRLLPELEALGVPAYMLDILGWGFGSTTSASDFSPAAKREHLYAFWKQKLGGRKMVLGGASLGGGIAMDFAAAYPQAVERVILLNPQGFIDGAPKVGPLGPLGIAVLGSWPLRWIANQIAYHDTEKYATWDAVRIGRLHVNMENWQNANLNYLNSGGYTLSPLPAQIQAPTLLIWGANDRVLDLDEQAPRFEQELKCARKITWIEDCGHVPHLEQPKATAAAIADFLRSPADTLCA